MKISKTGKIILGIVGLFSLVILGIALFSSLNRKETKSLLEVSTKSPIVFKGIVDATNSQNIYVNPKYGQVKEILIKDGSEVGVGTPVIKYYNKDLQQTVDDQERMYTRAKENYGSANGDLNKAYGEAKSASANIKSIQAKIDKIMKAQQQIPTNPTEQPLPSGDNYQLTKLQQSLAENQAKKQAADAKIDALKNSTKSLKDQSEDLGSKLSSLRESIYHIEKSTVKGIATVTPDAINDATPTRPVISIASDSVVIRGQISEYDYGKLKVNDKVELRLMNSDKVYTGTVNSTDELPASSNNPMSQGQQGASISNYNFTVLPDEKIHYGFNLQISLPQTEIVLPKEAVEKAGDKYYVYNVENGIAKRKEIKVTESKTVYNVVSGVKPKEKIISNVVGLSDGSKVNAK